MKPDHHHFAVRQIVLAGLVAGAAFAVNAQQGPADATVPPDAATAAGAQQQQQQQHRRDRADRAERRIERMQIRIAQHLAALQVRLRLTPAQQSAWDTFTQAVQPTPDELGRLLQARAQLRSSSLTTPERIERMRALRAGRDAALDKRFDAAKTLYAQLSPEQQKTFDSNALRWGGGGARGRHGRHHDGSMGMQHGDGGHGGMDSRHRHGARDHGDGDDDGND